MGINTVWMGFYILIVVQGIINLFGVLVPFQAPGLRNYTDESIKAWCRPNGIVFIVLGISMACFDAYMWRGINNRALLIGGLIGIVVALFISIVIFKIFLIKKKG